MEVYRLQEIGQLLNDTLSSDGNVVRAATDSLNRLLTLDSTFPFSLLFIAAGGESQGQKIAAATYLKNIVRRITNIPNGSACSDVSKEFRDALMRALSQVDFNVLKVLVEVFRAVVSIEFVKKNSWPDLVPEVRSAIQNSNLISERATSEWKTINALTVLQSLVRPFQYFLNPKLVKEPVPPQLEIIAQEILAPLLTIFHHHIRKALNMHNVADVETEKTLLIVCKCIYFSVRSHMPSALSPLLPSLCHDLVGVLNSLSFDCGKTLENGYLVRLKTAKRSLLLFCALIKRHRKFSEKLMPEIITCALSIVTHSEKISRLDFVTERIISLGFDVISHILETGPGWRLVSPHFSSLINTAIFPALAMNEKDIAEWEEDSDEYMRKNLPSELEEISGWREDLFTARKSALNLLGVISMSRGPPVATSSSSKRKKGEKNKRKDRSSMGELLVLPFLSKFPIPLDVKTFNENIISNYYGVLMAYSSLADFLGEKQPAYTASLIRTRVLPLYQLSVCQPYLVASANWLLGEIASCIPEEMIASVYSLLVKALTMQDMGHISCYPVRMSAAGAIAELVENDQLPPEWLAILEAIISRIGDEDEESSILFQLLSKLMGAGNEKVAPYIAHLVPLLARSISKYFPSGTQQWPQMVELGFAALAVMAKCWEESCPEDTELYRSNDSWLSGATTIATAFLDLLQEAWLRPIQPTEGDVTLTLPPACCMDDSSTLLRFVVQEVAKTNSVPQLKLSELLLTWANLIADWHGWEDMEDISIFNCIKEVVNTQNKFSLKNFSTGEMPSPPAPPVPRNSIIQGISAFVREAFGQYQSAVWRASSCVQLILHVPRYSYEAESMKNSLVMDFSNAAFSRFKEVQSKPCAMWKPLLFAISSCYLCCPDIVEKILEEDHRDGLSIWASALVSVSSRDFEHGLSNESEIKFTVLTFAKLVDRLLNLGNKYNGFLHDYFASLLETSVRWKECEEGTEEGEDSEDDDVGNDDTEDDDDDEDSEDDELEETEEEFLERYAEAAISLEEGTTMEGDVEDQDQEIEFGNLNEIELESTLILLIERCKQVLPQLGQPHLQLISSCMSFLT